MINCFVARPGVSGNGHEILQLLRHVDDFMGGTWQTIYGQAERGETAIAAALRELREETGLVPTEFYRLERVSVFYTPIDDTVWHCVPFFALVAGDARVELNDEHQASRWIALADAERHFMWKDDQAAIRDIVEVILGNGLAKQYLRVPIPML